MEMIEAGTPVEQKVEDNSSLREQVLLASSRYFAHFEGQGQTPREVYNLVMDEVEAALYEAVMKFTDGNQSKAALIMGVSRGTLRTKLKKYFSTTHVGKEKQ